jgi:aldose 1-epimerase
MWAVDDESMPTQLIDAPNPMNTSKGLMMKGSNLDNVFTGFSGSATVFWPEWKAKANISTSSNCEFMVVYSPAGEDFFCFEPVSHCTDALNMSEQGEENTGVLSLAPQKELTITMLISPEELRG